MPLPDCVEPDELRAFSLGQVDDDRFEQIQAHLVECASCEDTVAAFDDTADSLIASVRAAAGSAAADAEIAGGEVAGRLSESAHDSGVLKDALSRVLGQMPPPSEQDGNGDAASQVVERIRDYELVEQLGAGGMGTVYRALHTRLEREVALKLLPARRLRDTAAVARFEREMKAIGRLDHPAIVRATDAGVVDGTHFLAMDYVEGIDLSKLVRLNGPLDVASACEVIRQAAVGLQYAHEQELIHRDVKPSNLMLDRRGEVRILDLGLALFGAASEAVDELTTVGQLMGTLDYMAPEQGDNSHDVDARADVYSLGATLFKLLTGTAPYESSERRTPLSKMKALATIDAPSLANRSEGLPDELIAIVDRALSRDASDRFASAAEFASAVEPFCDPHQLVELAERGLELAADAIPEPHLPAIIPPFVHRVETTQKDRQPPRSRNFGSTLIRWLMLPAMLLAGYAIWLTTDTGTIHIQCADDNVPIEIRSGDEVVRKQTLSVGQNEVTIRSGRYEIALPKNYDTLKVEDSRIELIRGGVEYASITHVKRSAPGPGNAGVATAPSPGIPGPQPVFSGKTFDQWRHEVLTERNPKELEQAVSALCILGRGYRDREAAEVVLQILEPYPLETLPRRDRTVSVNSFEEQLVSSAIRQLRRLQVTAVIAPITAALQKDSPLLRRLIIEWLAEPRQGVFNVASSSSVGTSAPLRDALLASPEYIDTVLSLWDELDEQSRFFAFWGLVDQVRGKETNRKFVERLEELVRKPQSPFHIMATRLIAEINPRPELADLFLVALEKPLRFNPRQPQAWWNNEADAWIGLSLLREHAADETARIAALLTSRSLKDRIDNYAIALARSADGRVTAHVSITRRFLIYELLGRLGPAAVQTKPAIVKSMLEHFGRAPDDKGDFGFEAARPVFLLDEFALTSVPPVGQMIAMEANNGGMHEELVGSTRNAAVLALQRMTGSPVSYQEPGLTVSTAGNPADGLYGPESPGAGGDRPVPHDLYPKLVTYRHRRFEDWVAATENLANSKASLEEMGHMLTGVMVMGRTGEERERIATEAITRVLQHSLASLQFYVDGEPNTEPSDLAMVAYDRLNTINSNAAMTVVINTVLHGSDQARWLIVDRLANARTEVGHSVWPYGSEHSTRVNSSLSFRTALAGQFGELEWANHSSGLKHAMLRLAWRYIVEPAREGGLEVSPGQFVPSVRRLLDSTDPFERTEAAIIVSRLQVNADKADDPEEQARLQDILVDAIERTPPGIDQVDVILALSAVTSTGIDPTASRIFKLIQQDSLAESGPQPLLLELQPSPRASSPGGMTGYADGLAGPVPVGISTGTTSWKLVTSRRVLLLSLLSRSPLRDAKLRYDIGIELSQLVPTPIREFTESPGPLADLRARWITGHRTHGSKPGDVKIEADAFKDRVIHVTIKFLSAKRVGELLFGADTADTLPTPQRPGLYEGRSYEQWLETVESERSPIKLQDAVRAMRLLGEGKHDADVATAIMATIRLFENEYIDAKSLEGQFLLTAGEQLRLLDPKAILPPIVDAFRRGNLNQRMYVCQFLFSDPVTFSGKTWSEQGRRITELMGQSPELRDAMVETWNDVSQHARMHHFLFARLEEHFIHGPKTDPGVVALLKRLADEPLPEAPKQSPGDETHDWNELQHRKRRSVFHLTLADPDHPTLAKLCVDDLARPVPRDYTWWHVQKDAMLSLTRLGRRAADQLPRLIQLLEPLADVKTRPVIDDAVIVDRVADVPTVEDGRTFVLNSRIALVELIALIAGDEDSLADAIAVLRKIVAQKLPSVATPQGVVLQLTADDMRKDRLSLPDLLRYTGTQAHIRVDLNNPHIYTNQGALRLTDVESGVFQKTARLALEQLAPDPAE